MPSIAEIPKILLGALAILALVAAGVLASLAVLWAILVAAAGFALYAALRRFLPRRRPPGGSEVIEGEFRIERNEP